MKTSDKRVFLINLCIVKKLAHRKDESIQNNCKMDNL